MTCGEEDPDFVPFYAECDFIRARRTVRNAAFGDVVEPTVSFADTSKTKKASKKNPTVKELKAFLKEFGVKVKGNPRKAVLEEMFEEVRTKRAGDECFEAKLEAFAKEKSPKEEEEEEEEEDDELLNSPYLSEKGKRLALYELRSKTVKAKLARLEEEARWEREIREEKARRVKLGLEELCKTSDQEDSSSDSEDDDETHKVRKANKSAPVPSLLEESVREFLNNE